MLHWQSEIEQKLGEHNDQIHIIFEYLKQFEKSKKADDDFKNRPKIGFKTQKE
jgi:hypothetical protein